MDAGDGESEGDQFGALIFNERDERADDERRSAASNGGQLVAKGLAGAGGHDQQQVFAIDSGAADCFLVGAERRETEGALQ